MSIRQITLAAVAFFGATVSTQVRADLDDDIAESIDRAVSFLVRSGQSNRKVEHGLAQLALESRALVVAGLSTGHPVVAENFARFRKDRLDHTYTAAMIAGACDAALSQLKADQSSRNGRRTKQPKGGATYRKLLTKTTKALISLKTPASGSWGYRKGKNYDNSNTQFAVLALSQAARWGIRVPDHIWLSVALHLVDTQELDGPEENRRMEFESDVSIADKFFGASYLTTSGQISMESSPAVGLTTERRRTSTGT